MHLQMVSIELRRLMHDAVVGGVSWCCWGGVVGHTFRLWETFVTFFWTARLGEITWNGGLFWLIV